MNRTDRACCVAHRLSASCSQPVLPENINARFPVSSFIVRKVVSSPSGRRYTIEGWCRIEFEGTALYPTRDARATGFPRGLWLKLGWPVAERLRQLDGKRVLVEARFDPTENGHLGGYAGTLTDITVLELAPPLR